MILPYVLAQQWVGVAGVELALQLIAQPLDQTSSCSHDTVGHTAQQHHIIHKPSAGQQRQQQQQPLHRYSYCARNQE